MSEETVLYSGELSRKRNDKRFDVGCRVSGSFGEMAHNPNPNISRRVRQRIFGNIIEAVGPKQYKVLWDDGNTREHFSNSLKTERSFASLPPDVRPPRLQDNPDLPPQGQQQIDEEQEQIGEIERDQEMEEHLPGAGKESDDDDSSQGSKGGEGGDKAGGDTEGKMPGQLQAEVPLAPNYHAKKADAKAAIKLLLGKEVLVKHKNKSMAWTVIEDWDPEEPVLESDTAFGLNSFDCTQYTQRDVLAHLFLHLSFADWRVTLDKMNQAINEANNNNNKKRVRVFSAEEFLTALGLMIGAAEYGGRGSQLWEGQADCCGREKWESLLPDPNFDGIMKQYRFKDFRHFFPFAFKSETLKNNNDPWWEFAEAVNEFNNNRKTKLKLPKWLIIDESMSSWKPWQSPTGGLPNISFILRKPKPLGKSG